MKIEKKRIGVVDEEENMEKYVHVFLVNSWRMEERNQRKQISRTASRPRRCVKKSVNK